MENPDYIEINGVSYPRNKVHRFDIEEIREKNIFDDYRNANSSHVYFEFSEFPDRQIMLKQNFRLDKAGLFWDGSYLLSKYFMSLEKPADNLKPEKPLRILELGGSTSLPSICAALCGHEVITTDLENITKFMQESIGLNDLTGLNLKIKPLKWGNENHMKEIQGPFDYIFASELIYLEHVFEDLIKTLRYYCDENTKIIMVYKIRYKPKTDYFFSLFDKHFSYEHLDLTLLRKIIPNPDLYLLTAKLGGKSEDSKEENQKESKPENES